MGNKQTAGNNGGMVVAAVSKYLTLSKLQVLEIRDSCAQLASDPSATISRRFFHIIVSKAGVHIEPDSDVLDLLFTLWDLHGEDRVPCLPFLIGFSSLACRYESLASVLRFAMEVYDKPKWGTINAQGLIMVLKALSMTASYFGDSVLNLKQIYKVVDSVFDTMTFISYDPFELLSHSECIQLLVQEPLMQAMVTKTLRRTRVSFLPKYPAFSMHDHRPHDEAPPPPDHEQYHGGGEDSGTEFSTDVSDVMLTPLAKIPVKSTKGDYSSDEHHGKNGRYEYSSDDPTELTAIEVSVN